MACGSCGGNRQGSDYLVTYADGTTRTFTAKEGGVQAARIEAGANKGATVKAIPRKTV